MADALDVVKMYKVNEEKLKSDWDAERKPIVNWEIKSTSSPVKDLRSWQTSLGYLCGTYGNLIEFNYKTFISIQESFEYRTLGYDRIVTISDLINLLWGVDTKIIINDMRDGKVVMKSVSGWLPDYYSDLEATVY
jgi:hypothetical protein